MAIHLLRFRLTGIQLGIIASCLQVVSAHLRSVPHLRFHREDCGSFVYMVDMIVAAAQHEKIVRFSFGVRARQIIIQRILFER